MGIDTPPADLKAVNRAVNINVPASQVWLTIEQILAILSETPPRIAALTAGLAPDRLHAAPGDGEWSANDVLAHLRAYGDVWGSNIMAMLAEDTPVLRAVSPRTWIRKTDYSTLEFGPSFRAFTTQRTGLLAVLGPLPPEGWLRAATVTGMLPGQLLQWTVLTLAERMARHEWPHVKQIERIVVTMRV